VPYYLARVDISAEGVQALTDAKLALLPGMPAEVLVNTGERTLLQYLIAPVSNIAARSFKQH
jgi:epimerase transport system membrane fusion protein